MAEETHVLHTQDQPLKVLLKTTHTGYKWEITVMGKDLAEIMPKLREADTKLRREYGEKREAV